MLYTKSILKRPERADGKRISVMSRHTLNDGKTPDPRIQSYDVWLKQLAPPDVLVGAYYKRGLIWEKFEAAYREYIQRTNISHIVRTLAYDATEADITLLCIEETAENCHRRLLAEECCIYQPMLRIEHR